MADKHWMIYGAYGYTGRLCAAEAVRRGLRPVLGGRNAAELEPMARGLNLEPRVFDLARPESAAKRLADVDAVLNCAGPFSKTARPMLEACARSKTHYLDVTGEIDVFEFIHQNRTKWVDAGIAVIPGVGFDVVPSDCLAAMLKNALPAATRLLLAFKAGSMKLSPGTAKTVAEGIADGCRVRRDGRIESMPLGSKTATIPFPGGPAEAVVISWGDVSTAYYSTGIPNIEVYTAFEPGQLLQLQRMQRVRWLVGTNAFQRIIHWIIAKTVHGPSEDERAASWSELYGEVTDNAGQKAAITMRTPEGYDLTFDSAVTATVRLLQKAIEPGPYTPSMAFGADFVLTLRGVACERQN